MPDLAVLGIGLALGGLIGFLAGIDFAWKKPTLPKRPFLRK